MGCDIHFSVEVKQSDGTWKEAKTGLVWGNDGKDYIFDGITEEEMKSRQLANGYPKDENLEEDEELYHDIEFYHGRNYDLFGILAGVRSDTFEPISEPKGLPHDLSEGVAKKYDRWKGDAHSMTWLSLKELQEYDWKTTFNEIGGLVPASEYIRWKASGETSPQYYCGFTNAEVISEEDFLKELEQPKLLPAPVQLDTDTDVTIPIEFGGRYVDASWMESGVDVSFEFTQETIPALERLIPEGGTSEDVRCVFWFDN